jgi:hypothetical protein
MAFLWCSLVIVIEIFVQTVDLMLFLPCRGEWVLLRMWKKDI